ncbi:MAG: hypothetical protein R3C44_15270 [Chloroflexota bacterium]
MITVLDECFTAIAGQGAEVTSSSGTHSLQVTDETNLISSLIGTGYPYDVHTSPDDNPELHPHLCQDGTGTAAGRFGCWTLCM